MADSNKKKLTKEFNQNRLKIRHPPLKPSAADCADNQNRRRYD